MNIDTFLSNPIKAYISCVQGFSLYAEVLSEELNKVLKEYTLDYKNILLTGSRLFLSHTEDSDFDVVVLCNSINKGYFKNLGYVECGSSEIYCSDDTHYIVKKEMSNGKTLNLIIVNNEDTFYKWEIATELTYTINNSVHEHLNKGIRKLIFSTIIDNKYV